MIMNTNTITEEFSASNDHIIVKGKRTKRPRHSSSSSSTGCGGADSFLSSPTSSSGISTSTEEDEDLANCLILLARGGLGPQTKRAESKLSTKKFAEMAAATANAKAGIYVYECKTCSRTFPSFQALGGHRASHKKPKAAADFDHKRSPPPPQKKDHVMKEEVEDTVTPPPSSHVENKPKLHECSICGSEFASGQALGGHMRRHRSGPNISSAAVAAVKSDDDDNLDQHRVVERTRNLLSLDLNLPAPLEDERREAEFRAFSSNQQPRLVFAAAALVDCHY